MLPVKRVRKMADHAVVIGAGVGGLLAARVLLERAGRVTVIERDGLPETPAPRPGVPQDRHLHSLTTRGSELLERFFPGLDAELAAAGAPLMDQTADVVTALPAGRLPRFVSGITMRSASRALLEHHIRLRLRANFRIRFLERREVTGLMTEGDRVCGVRGRVRGGGGEFTLPADVVLDASGQNSRAPRWLEELGYEPPRETVVNARLGYATRWYRVPEDFDGDWQALAVLPGWPENPRGGVLRRVEGDRFTAVMIGMGGDYPPSEAEGFLKFARSLPDPLIYEVIRNLEPVSPVYGFRNTANRRRHYERLRRMPEGLLVFADAATVMNPAYGQGMTAAALSAAALEDCPGGRGFGRRFHRRQVRAVAPCWTASVSSDRQWAGEPTALRRLFDRISGEVLRLATEDRAAARTLLEVKNVLRPPAALARPGLLIPALARSVLPGAEPPGTVRALGRA